MHVIQHYIRKLIPRSGISKFRQVWVVPVPRAKILGRGLHKTPAERPWILNFLSRNASDPSPFTFSSLYLVYYTCNLIWEWALGEFRAYLSNRGHRLHLNKLLEFKRL